MGAESEGSAQYLKEPDPRSGIRDPPLFSKDPDPDPRSAIRPKNSADLQHCLSQLSNVGSIKKEIISLLIVFFFLCVGWVGKEQNTIQIDINVLFHVFNDD